MPTKQERGRPRPGPERTIHERRDLQRRRRARQLGLARVAHAPQLPEALAEGLQTLGVQRADGLGQVSARSAGGIGQSGEAREEKP